MVEQTGGLIAALEKLAQSNSEFWTVSACGVTQTVQGIPVLLDHDAYASKTSRVRVLLVGGLSGDAPDTTLALQALELFSSASAALSPKIALSAVPCVNVDGTTSGKGGSRDLSQGYPPQDNFYFDAEAPESRYIWRWTCLQAPDLLLELRCGDLVRWECNDAVGLLPVHIGASKIADSGSLLGALGVGRPDGIGPIPGLRLTVNPDNLSVELSRLWDAIMQVWSWRPSAARQELIRRRSRSNLEVANILDSKYGHRLETVVYTQGVAISGRLRLARLQGNSDKVVPQISAMLEEHLSGAKDPLGSQPNGSTLAGVVWAYDLGRDAGDQRAIDLLLRAADCYQTGKPGAAPAPADPDFRVEDMFYCGAMLGRAYRLTGKEKYLNILTGFLLAAGIQQENGLFWHARSAPYFWSRGNGFAALGFAEALTYLPNDHPKRSDILRIHLNHLAGLRGAQQPTGMYCQMLDFPGSYHEFTSTCMIGYAMARGLRRGWLDSSYRDSLDLAWRGVKERIDDEGSVIDSCISTGVQQNLKEYLDRTAIFGPDDRSGSLALWFAVEMERLAQGA